MITILKIRLSYFKRDALKKIITFLLPILFLLMLIIFEGFSRVKSQVNPIPKNYENLNYSFNLINEEKLKLNKTFNYCLITNNKTIMEISRDILKDKFNVEKNISNFDNYSIFLNYINSKEYNSSNITFNSFIEIIELKKGRKYRFKSNNITFESTLTRLNKLNLETNPNNDDVHLINQFFYFASLLEQRIEKKEINSQLIISNQTLKQRPQYNTFSLNFTLFTSALISLSYCFIVYSLFDWIIEEKEKQLNHFFYRQGISKLYYYLSWLVFFIIISIIPSFGTSFIISFFFLYHGIYLYNFLIYFLFIINIFGFCFFFVSFVEKVDTGQKIVKIIYIGSIFIGLLLLQTGISNIVRIVLIFLPNINLMISINLIIHLDNFEIIDWTLLTTKHNKLSLFDSFLLSIISFLIYIIFGTIIISYKEGNLKYLFSSKESEEEEKGEKIDINSTNDQNLTQFDIHHENLSEKNQVLLNQKNCLSIKNVYKIFGDLKAVNNFNGDIFPDEIFCLLGHNGAGKTTLIKMISGLEDLDNGDILLDGVSLVKNKDYLYQNIGLCTQENLFFDDLTVEEHLRLMAELKGQKTNMEEIYNLINSLDLYKKKDDFAKNLSGGQKRKLCIALALIGNSKLILLDEPTSGMDIIAQKELWSFLEQYKKNKIIILTTHSLNEAEYLGDRIGIMNQGRFICSGTSSYLKNNYPCGYTINILIDSKKSSYQSRRDLFNQLKNIDNTSEIKIESKYVFSINFLNLDNRVKDIFNLIDSNSEQYGINNYTVSTTSLEDVFIKLNDQNYSNQNLSRIDDEIIMTNENQLLDKNEKISFCKQLVVNIKKNLITLKRTKIKFLIEIISSSIFVIFYIGISQYNLQTDKNIEQNLTYLLTQDPIYYSTINCDFNIIKNSTFVKDNSINFKEINISKTTNITQINDEFYKQMKYHYEKLYIVLIQESSEIKALIFTQNNEFEFYIAATNLIFSSFYEYQTKINISAFNEISKVPLGIKETKVVDYLMKLLSIFVIWFSFILFISNMIEIPLFDRYNNVKHLLFLSGENMFAYWIGFIIVDLIKFIIYALILLLILYSSDKVYLYCFFFEIPFFLSLIIIIYCISYVFDNISNANMFYNILIIFGTFFLIIISATHDIIKLLNVANIDKFEFSFIHDLLPSSTFLLSLFFILSSKGNDEENKLKNYAIFVRNKSLIFLIQIIFYSIILFLLEIRIIQRLVNYILTKIVFDKNSIQNNINSLQQILLNNASSEYINKEKEKVISNKNLTTKIINLSKTYFICCGNNIRAVRNLNLGLESNEKFGLLGFNGSGKSTTFKCITNQILYENGEISLFNLNNQKDFETIRKNIGYCPQENALFEYLNVTDTLNYYKELKGISENIDSLLERFGLKNYKKTICKNLSGGNKRKLTFAIALMGNPKIILLDEPSSSVDPESRRGMWKNINLLSKNGNNYNMILTTHSIEEAEVLCDTISWFKDGNFVCVGNPEKLKIKYSIGYLLQVKFNSIDNSITQDSLSLEELNSKFVINQGLFMKIAQMEKIKEHIRYLIGFIDEIRKNIYKIELRDVDKDYSFNLAIGINNETKSEFFIQILSMKNKKQNVSEISINMESLENILPNIY